MKDLEGDLEIFICFQVDINNMHFSLIPELRTTDAMYTLCQMRYSIGKKKIYFAFADL